MIDWRCLLEFTIYLDQYLFLTDLPRFLMIRMNIKMNSRNPTTPTDAPTYISRLGPSKLKMKITWETLLEYFSLSLWMNFRYGTTPLFRNSIPYEMMSLFHDPKQWCHYFTSSITQGFMIFIHVPGYISLHVAWTYFFF